MSRTRWLRDNSYKYKLQIVLIIFLISILSGCALVLNDLLKGIETTEIVDFNIYYEGFYSEKDGIKIFGEDFNINDLIDVTVNSTSTLFINGIAYNFPEIIYLKNNIFDNNITPSNLTLTKQSLANISIDFEVTISYYSTPDNLQPEATEIVLRLKDSTSINLEDTSKLTFVIGIDNNEKLVYYLLKEGEVNTLEESSLESNVYYITDSLVYFSSLKLEDNLLKIYYPSSMGSPQLYSY
ncbi:MAG: hypothetical protein H0Z24_01345 [Thermosipho sp. (in: Bacteria)]|nr:hypothetical protein [Thermosipho sp. (in: thermotogales)]